MTRTQMKYTLVAGAMVWLCPALGAQTAPAPPSGAVRPAYPRASYPVEDQPDAERTKQELSNLLQRYPPSLRQTLAIDPSLLENEPYLATYPALASFLNAHPGISRSPRFYFPDDFERNRDPAEQTLQLWHMVWNDAATFAGFSLAVGLLIWLVRTLIDYRRWIRLAKVQTDVHTKLLDRFTANDELLAYIQSPAGSRFLSSSPIMLDAAPRGPGAPMSRILWSVQGGVVLFAAGAGLQLLRFGRNNEAAAPLHALGVLALALGAGFLVSAIISFVISRRLGLIEATRTDHVA